MSVSFIPESAPFNSEQRAWLNGFLAGWTGVVNAIGEGGGGSETPLALIGGAAEAPPAEAAEEDEEFPWHDPALNIDERLALAEEKPLKRKMMAAMAQLDCGACGYLCQTYSEAIAAGEETNLKLCSPGGKETAKALKRLLKEEGDAGPVSKSSSNGAVAATAKSNPAAGAYSRANPYEARIVSCENLNLEGSQKITTHAVIDLGDSGLQYEVGDSLGVYPTNCLELVDEVIAHLGAEGDEGFRAELVNKYNLREVSDELLDLLASRATNSTEKTAVEALVDADDLDEMDVLDVLGRAPSAQVAPAELLERLSEIAPRLYSIASSLKAHPGEVHLTIGRATVQIGDRTHKGVASTMFADRLCAGDPVRVYVHKSHGFTVPADPTAPMIMVGPGTGIAPFRAFLEERQATSAGGKNWLFFGDQHETTDFLYREQFDEMLAGECLSKLSTAFSRDQEEKLYVQTRMRQEGAELFAWLEEGGYFFVCGDAKRMAADVDRALHDVVATHGGMSPEQAQAYVAQLKEEGRYARDVY